MKDYFDITECMKNAAKTDRGITIVLSETEEKYLSYQDIWTKSYGMYRCLTECGVEKQDGVVVYCSNLENIIYSLWACAIGGFVAMPVAYDTKRIFDNEFAVNLHNPYIIIDQPIQNEDVFRGVFDITKLQIPSLHFTDTCSQMEYSEEDLICVQFSSGSTGLSKGIPITRMNLCANLSDEIECFQINEKDIVVNWEPLTHSGGLIIFHYMAIIAGIPQYLMPPEVYIKNPLLWLAVIHKTRATITGSVPFALKHFMNIYENLQDNCKWDLSCLKVMTLGAEHVGAGLYKQFTEMMKKYNFKPSAIITTYGLSEATCLVAYGINDGTLELYTLASREFRYGGEVIKSFGNGLKQEYILYSTIANSTEVKIVDEEGKQLPNGTVGNICMKGPSIIKGYFTKQGVLTDNHFRDGWFDTGDLGFLIDGRQLGITGRVKDIVVIGGENFECSALENTIKSGIENRLIKDVIVCNLVDKSGIECIGAFVLCSEYRDNKEFIKEFTLCSNLIREKIYEEYRIYINNIIPINEIPRTGSGKVKRMELVVKYNNGDFEKIMKKIDPAITKESDMPDVRAIALKLVQIISDEFHINITDFDRSFQEYGIVSINIPTFIAKINELFKVDLKATCVFSYPNISSLSEYIQTALNLEQNTYDKYAKQNNSLESIAIVGMSCRFPQGGNSPEEFWDLLINGIDAVTDIPKERWRAEKYFSDNDKEEGKMYCNKGAFLNVPIDQFDPKFFNISPKEAVELDPHHRMLIELTWEAFENAGLDISQYSGSRTGVFLGLSSDEYGMTSISSGNVEIIDSYSLTGVCKSTACGRLSYIFGFEGPSLTVDTACSSSLTALHLACNSIRNSDADVAVVGGASLMLTPTIGIAFSKLQATSHDGHCKTFDANANGYGRGEGAGVIILKRLSEAIQDNDNILGVIRSTGLNQDGKSNGLTAPNGEAQRKLIEHTLKTAGIQVDEVEYIETHGTGTPLGDPIEVNAIIEAYGKDRTKNNPLLIGSVKSNVGHLEAASGMASIIKVLLSFKHRVIPGDLHYFNPNPQIAWKDSNIEVVDKNTNWFREGRMRRAGINSFGFGGSNAHVVLEEYRSLRGLEGKLTDQDSSRFLLKISGKSKESIKKLAKGYQEVLQNHGEDALYNILYTANRGRGDYSYRAAVTGTSINELMDGIDTLIQERRTGNVFSSAVKQNKKLMFMFTGQGSQYVDMCRKLFDTNAAFKEAMLRCDRLFRPFILRSLVSLIYSDQADHETVDKTVYAQPLIFSVEYSLCRLWESYGIRPDIVIGHSIGEYAAAVEAGILSLEAAAELVSARGRLMDSAPGSGAMATIFADFNYVSSLISEYSDQVVIAVHNAPEACVISGEKDKVNRICEKANDMGLRVRQLKVSHGFHSPLMKSAAENFKAIAEQIEYHRPKLSYISCLHAREVRKEEVLDASYWSDHITNRVDFYHALESVENKQDIFMLEVGPTSSLEALCKLIYGNSQAVACSINRTTDDLKQIMDVMAKLYVAGLNIDWDKVEFNGIKTWNRTSLLPNYPFERASYWKEIMYDRKLGMDEGYASTDSLLGQRIESIFMEDSVIFQRKYTTTSPFFMSEHIIYKTAIAPAAAYVSILISAMKEIRNPKSITIRDIELRAPLIITEHEERLVQIVISHAWSENCEYMITSKSLSDDNGPWVIHSQGVIGVNNGYIQNKKPFMVDQWDRIEKHDKEENIVYRAMVNAGFDLGVGFRRVKRSSCDKDSGICYIEPLKSLPHKEDYVIYPGVIDSIFHTMLSIILEAGYVAVDKENNWETMIPYFVSGISYNYLASDNLWCSSNAVFEHQSIIGDVDAFNEYGDLIMQIDNMITKITTEKNLLSGVKKDLSKLIYHCNWVKYEAKAAKRVDYSSVVLITDQASDYANLVRCWQANDVNARQVAVCGYLDYDWEKLVSEEVSQQKRVLFVYGCGSSSITSFENNEDILKHAVDLAKAISQLHAEKTCSLGFITVQAVAYKNQAINLKQAMLWGFARSFAMEFTGSFRGIVDLDGTMSTDDWKIAAEVILSGASNELCLRAGELYISRLMKHSIYEKRNQEKLDALKISGDGTYLVTGGTGLLGMTYLEALTDLGAKKIAILCRNQPGSEVIDRIDRWNSHGLCIRVFRADVGNLDSLSAAVDLIHTEMGEINGVVHAAGVLKDKMLQDLTWEDYQYVMSPKVTGCINLYRVLHRNKLDFFIMLSSITSILGNVGQSNYAAANCFMNSFAAFLNQQNKNGFVQCWGPWEGAGMASDQATLANMDMMGMEPIMKAEGKRMICDFFANPYELMLIADINWDKFIKNSSGSIVKELLSDLVSAAAPVREGESNTSFKERVTSMNKLQIVELLTNEIKQLCSKIMDYDISAIDADNSFKELGADSLMIFSMRTEINQLLHSNINVAAFYNYPTISLFAEYLADEVLELEDASEKVVVKEKLPHIVEKQQLYKDEDADDLLMELEELLK
jgi:acyl transferase domain-containing protein/acyl-CoA synthetase (AMP-forming)/AMP-acid ligase II/NADP-dependent 3-hydroxy acid dehydrogenase YdfG/acyl carrier protein